MWQTKIVWGITDIKGVRGNTNAIMNIKSEFNNDDEFDYTL